MFATNCLDRVKTRKRTTKHLQYDGIKIVKKDWRTRKKKAFAFEVVILYYSLQYCLKIDTESAENKKTPKD